ncbi:MAG: SLAP domain-containing protein [Oscillospiraceae bacterium]|nr:SLAP domain-containing protein [Oscillospiraceae bacterium]
MAKKRDLMELDMVSGELEKLKKQSAQLSLGEDPRQKQRKLVVILCSILGALIVAVFVGIIVYVESQCPVSYGPKASAEEQTSEKTAEHERRLKIIDENGGVREGVNFVGYYARFDDESNLVIDGYMRNFTGHEIYDITGNITVKTPAEDNIGGAYFEFSKEDFGTLKNGHSRPWRIIFSSDYVNIEITDLSEFTITTEFDFTQK